MREPTHDGALAGQPLLVRAGVALVVAVGVNVVLVLGAGAVGIAPGFLALSVPPVAFLSALGVAGATLTYWLLGRLVATPERTFVRVAVALLVVSFIPDVGLLWADPTATVVGVVLLMVMHVVVAGVAVEALVGVRR